mgnify:CR=1 FL=1
MKKRKRLIFCFLMLPIFVALVVWIVWSNSALVVNEVVVSSDKIPHSFGGYRIAQVSDLHNATFGVDNGKLLDNLKACNPDVIVLTGDLVDSYRTDIDISIAFTEKATQIAPTYFVTGNHESRISEYDVLIEKLEAAGVTVLNNEAVVLERDAETIMLLGVSDPSFQVDYLLGDAAPYMDSVVSELMQGAKGYTVLLSHRPEFFDVYTTNNVDLVLTGHAHGGQFRLPFVGGLVAPGQGLFPKYDAGLYVQNETNMIVSRGLGNSLFPFRINNRPEIIVVTLNR